MHTSGVLQQKHLMKGIKTGSRKSRAWLPMWPNEMFPGKYSSSSSRISF